MALVTKTIRCAVCGSSDVAFDGKIYHCASCGTDSEVSMPAAAQVGQLEEAAKGHAKQLEELKKSAGDNEELTRLRRQYKNLDIASWDSENRLQTK